MGRKPSGSRCGDPGIGFAHRVAEAPDLGGVLHAARRLDAGGDVNGPGPQLLDAGNDVCGMQPTRQNEPMAERLRERATNRKPFLRRRSPRRGHRGEGLAPGRNGARSLANRSPAPCARRAGTGARTRCTARRFRRHGTAAPASGCSASARSISSGAALTKRPTGVTNGGSARASARGALGAEKARAAADGRRSRRHRRRRRRRLRDRPRARRRRS